MHHQIKPSEIDPSVVDSLATLHPDYTQLELNEAHAQLKRYFDLAWAIFVRLEAEGKLDQMNLTARVVNPTVKPPANPHP